MVFSAVFVALVFVLFVVVVALVIAILLVRDIQRKETIFHNYKIHLNQIVVVLAEWGEVLDVLPQYATDPFFSQIIEKKSLEGILPPADDERLKGYIKGLDAYPDIPFIFSYAGESGFLWYELRAHVRTDKNERVRVLVIQNVTSEAVSRLKLDSLQERVDLLLQNTGDFLWSFDADERRFSLLTPIIDEEGRVVPRSMGVQDIHTLFPGEDCALFERRINARIVDYRASGHDVNEQAFVRLRMIGDGGKMVWYSFRCKLSTTENSKLVFRGVARRMDLLLDNSMDDEEWGQDYSFASVMAMPDVRIFCVDREYKVIFGNMLFALTFGHNSPKRIVGKRLPEVVRPKYFSFMQGIISDVFETGKARSWKGPFERDGRLLWFNATPIKSRDGSTQRVMGVYIPIDIEDFNSLGRGLKISAKSPVENEDLI